MIAAGEFHDFAAFGICAGNADGGHHGLGTGVDETDLIHRRDGFLKHLCQLNLKPGRRSVQNTVLCGFCNRCGNMRMGMSGNDRAIGGEVINVLIAVFIPKA
ncbi:hypothetical protein D3C75_554440 [compost metagenome]